MMQKTGKFMALESKLAAPRPKPAKMAAAAMRKKQSKMAGNAIAPMVRPQG